MSIARKIAAVILLLVIMAAVIAFMIIRIGDIIGWDKALDSWPMVVLLAVLVLLVCWLIVLVIRSRMNR
ncbi:MAG: hypothetical protein FWF18_02045 [Dehalococcoidia bacterium]|nr:hypothetical protein [Dehalococcoidia bacterium]